MTFLSRLSVVLVVMVGAGSLWAAEGILPGSGTEADPYLIEDFEDFDVFADLENAATYWASGVHARLDCDIDLIQYTGTDFNIIGKWIDWDDPDNLPFTGIFDGDGHVVSNFIYTCTETSGIGLFGYLGVGGEIKDLGMEDSNIVAPDSEHVGILVGHNKGTINNCYSTGSIEGGNDECIGGLVGGNHGAIIKCYSSSNVTVGSYTGCVGGLVGENWNGTIENSYSTGCVIAGDSSEAIGGLVGDSWESTITNCYSTGCVESGESSELVGGLAGGNGGTITNCYSTGPLAGGNGSVEIGGMCGYSDGTIRTCYFLDTAGPDNGHGTPLTDTLMKQQGSYVGWDFTEETINGTDDTWRMCQNGESYPRLTWQFSQYGDFLCPNGVSFKDFSVLADEWLSEGTLTSDINYDGITDLSDLLLFCENWLFEDNISDHVSYIDIETGIDFSAPDTDSDDEYEFCLSVLTDTTVEKVKVIMPSGSPVEITKNPEGCVGGSGTLTETCHIFEDNGSTYEWVYSSDYDNLNDLAVYDGSYTFIFYYENGYQHQTVVSFTTPGTSEPIPQPTQKPVYTRISHNETFGSPITLAWEPFTLAWEPYTNPDLYLISIDVTNTNIGEDVLDVELPVSATELGELVYLDEGFYEIDLGYGIEYNNVNQDGIQFELSKWIEVDYFITIQQ